MKHDGEVTVVKTSILDGNLDERLEPKMEFFVANRRSYVAEISGAKQFDTMP